MIALPGICRDCRQPVTFNGHVWRDAVRRHRCQRLVCGAWMPVARERCARRPGHASDHRTQYCMDNAHLARTGRTRTTAKAHTAGVETSDTPFMSRPASRLSRLQAGRLDPLP